MKNSKTWITFALALASAAIPFSLAVCAQAQTVTVVAAETSLGMVQATDGNFYGAGYLGNNFNGGIFRMTPAGEISTVYSFCSQPNCADGTQPTPPVLGSDGNLYGVARFGGNSSGSGTFYKLTLDGKLTVLYTFCPNAGCADGQYPQGVILASDGNFYGASAPGGEGESHGGTLFRITPAGGLKLLYTFCSLANCADGEDPTLPPVQGSDGNFYGVAALGGLTGHGVAYRVTSSGAYTVLYHFCSATDCLDGNQPQAVTWSPSGTLLGITNLGGNRGGGTVFEINLTKNHFRTLHNFNAYVDGDNPFYALTLANDGNFYGVVGDDFASGYIYEETAGSVYTSLYNFACCGLGSNPFGPLLQATDGKLYGETEYSNVTNTGAIFRLSNGIGPAVQPVPVAGKVGQTIIILGNGLTGSTRVAFNGVAAAFTVKSDTYIKARVPLGAITGAVSVVTPSGTLNSNPQFVVTK